MQTLSIQPTKTLKIQMRPEEELLLCCARTYVSEETGDRIQTLLHANLDWNYLFQIAACHGVIPLLALNLKNFNSGVIPATYLEELQLAFQRNVRNNLILTQELIKLLRLFEDQSIPALAFKGPLLAASAYGNFSFRQISDLDILVNEQNLDHVTELLTNQGYELRINVPWERHLIRQNGLYNIDLHQAIAPKHLSCSLTNQEVWQHLQPFTLGGTTVANLSPEMTLLVLCLHGTKEGWWHLNRICDVAELIRNQNLDWQQVISRAEKHGNQRLISLGLLLAHQLLNASLTDEIQQLIKNDPVVPSLAAKVQNDLFLPKTQQIGEVERTVFHISTRERLRDRVHVFLGLMNHSGWLTPTKEDENFLPLPKFLAPLYYLVRPVRVMRKYKLQQFSSIFFK